MDEIYIVEAANEYTRQFESSYENPNMIGYAVADFIAGAKWMQERMEEIKLTENR